MSHTTLVHTIIKGDNTGSAYFTCACGHTSGRFMPTMARPATGIAREAARAHRISRRGTAVNAA